MQKIKLTQIQKEGLEQFVSDHITYCNMSIYDDFYQEDGLYDGKYCGCDVCQNREYINAVFDYLKKENILEIEE